MISEMQKSNSIRRSHIGILLDLCWLIIFSFLGFIFVDLTEPIFRHVSPWYLWLLVVSSPILLIQGLFYWLFQKRLFARKNTMLWTIGMSVLVFIDSLILISMNMDFKAIS